MASALEVRFQSSVLFEFLGTASRPTYNLGLRLAKRDVPMLSFTFLGPVSIHKDGQPLKQFRSQKEAALLIYLAHTGESHSRDFVADLLWESRSTQQALSNLRTVLTRLRKQAGESLLVSRKSLALTSESQQQVDSATLLQTLATFTAVESAEKAQALQTSLDAYQGHFLADFYLADAPQFDKWVLSTREHIRRQVIAAYDKLVQYTHTFGNTEDTVRVVRRWLQIDHLDEAAHSRLIQLLLEDGQTHVAQTHYNHYAELLHTELSVAPSGEIKALLKNVPQTPVVVERPVSSTGVHHNLPAPYDQFFGRTTAQTDIHDRLDQDWCRLVTIVGPGGVGKTRLATTIARKRLQQYPDGVWLVELADIDPDDDDLAEAIVVEIATALDLRLSGSEKPIEQLYTYLQHKTMLLVLDNFEHLLEGGVSFVLDVLQRSEKVQFIVTSREALRIRAEWIIALTGLRYPTDDADDTPSDALDLFAARRIQQRQGGIPAAEFTAMGQICRLVEGLPLALELAAAIKPHATIQEVAAELRDGFEMLSTSLRDVPQRHRSLQVVFEMSWRTLTPALQQRLTQLSVFRGGFAELAAQQITKADSRELADLTEKSLLAHDVVTGRYRLHAIVRTFADKKRDTLDQTPLKHADYYLDCLAQHTEPLQKDAPQQSIAVLEPDIANIRLAWQTGLVQRSAAPLSAALTSLSIYYQLRGLAREAESVMQNTLRMATTWGTADLALITRAGLERARFQIRLGRYKPAIQTVETALDNAQQCADRWAHGMGHVLWGEALWRLGEYNSAESKLNYALTMADDLDDTLLLGWCHHHLGVINDIQSRYDAAHDHLEKACDAWRELEQAQALSGSLNSKGLVCFHQGDLVTAQQAMEEALSLSNQLDNRHSKSSLLNNLSMISTERGDYMGAHHYLQLGLELASITGNLTRQVEVTVNLGRNYHLLGKTDLAVEYLEKGVNISERIGNRSLQAIALGNLANTKRSQQEQKRAESLYIRALTIAREDHLQHTECEISISIAELLSKHNERKAKKYSKKAVALAEVIQNPELLKRAIAIDQYLGVSVGVED
ncbi:MAG: tetratricopeptide repeat protein [Chloroflexota bacterium]